MGTRCLTYVYDELQNPLLCIYRQFDGYPSGHGLELVDFLKGRVLVNGFNEKHTVDKKFSNGMGCLAAALVASLKTCIGNIYIQPVDDDTGYHDYEYHIFRDSITVKNFNRDIMYSGTWDGFENFCWDDE